jgi:phosphatidylglycerol:prolipoprotein diacylglycerol transferase
MIHLNVILGSLSSVAAVSGRDIGTQARTLRAMNPVLFTVFGRPIYWYGVMAALGFASVAWLWSVRARREGRPVGFGSDLAVWLMVGGILGARAAYVLANWGIYCGHPLEIFRVDQGGLIYYGGFVGGVAACILFARRRKLPAWEVGDFAVLGLPLAHALGRVGCFLNGCCYGRETSVAWAAWVEGARRHPVQLYEAALNAALFAVLLSYRPANRRAGARVALYLTVYPVIRFLLEFLRGDPRRQGPAFNVAQWVSLGLFAVGCVLWAVVATKTAPPREGRPE